MPADLYDVLGASNDDAAEEIKRAYRERVREYHPDVNDHPEGDAQFKLIRTANDVLSDPAERKDYDRLGHRDYVEKHLDDLPPVSVFPDEDLPEGTTTDGNPSTDTSTADSSTTKTTTDRASDARTTDTAASDSSGPTDVSSGTSADDSGYGSAGSTDQSASTTETTSGGETTSTAGGTSSTTSGASSTTDESPAGETDAGGRTTTAGAERSSWDAATNSTRSTAESTVPAGVRRRRGLRRWYGVVALSLLLYLAGLGLYGLPRQAALRGFVDDVTAAPVATLLGPFPLASPTAYLLDAVQTAIAGTPDLGLVLLAGTVLLPLVVLTTVGRFGRGAAWMYALPSLAPAICFAVWPAVAVPTWLALLGLIVFPILSGGGFLVDVGRYLRATR